MRRSFVGGVRGRLRGICRTLMEEAQSVGEERSRHEFESNMAAPMFIFRL